MEALNKPYLKLKYIYLYIKLFEFCTDFGGVCEPNEFKCNNGKCVLKTWICDSDDDCGDNSDEQNCGARENGRCSPVEFACKSQNQCIPKSFHCDLQSDCFDGSDEIGCGQFI